MSLEGSTPSPSACRLRDWSNGTTPGFQPGDRGSTPRSRTRSDVRCVPGRAVRRGLARSDRRVRLPRGALGNRLTGRLPDLESGGGGSNPPSRIRGGSCWSLRHTLNVEVAGSIPAPGTRLHALTEAIRPDQGPVLKTGGGPWAACGFESHGFRLAGPGYANGRAARLKPGCLWVRLPPRVLGHGGGCFRLGRQWADHSRSEREMLRVRIPPEPVPGKTGPWCNGNMSHC